MSEAPESKTPEEMADEGVGVLKNMNFRSANIATLNQTLQRLGFTQFSMSELKSMLAFFKDSAWENVKVMLMNHVPGPALPETDTAVRFSVDALRAKTKDKVRKRASSGQERGRYFEEGEEEEEEEEEEE